MRKLCCLLLLFYVSPAFAADYYYVSPSGSGNVCSEQNPCTLAAAQRKAADGDTIFLRGGIYRGAQGIPFRMTKAGLTWQNYEDEEPVIDGEWSLPTGDYSADNNVSFKSLITVAKGAHDVTIDGLIVRNSRGRGIDAQFGDRTKILNCNVSYTNHTGIMIGDKTKEKSEDLIDNCDVTYGNYCKDSGVCNAWQYIQQNVQIKGGHNTVRNSRIGYGGCAGIEGFLDHDSLIENNVVYGNNLTQIHVAASKDSTIRNNLIYGTARESESSNPTRKGGYGDGLAIMIELWYDQSVEKWDQGHEVYGNVVANCKRNLILGWQIGKNDSHKENKLSNNTIFNNTFIEPYLNLEANTPWSVGQCVMLIDGGYFGTGKDKNVIKNNIFWARDKMTAGDGKNVDMDYNLWSSQPPTSFRGENDPTYGPLDMADYFSKTSGWSGDAVKYGDIVKADFALLDTAIEAIDTGTEMGQPYKGLAPDCGALEYSSDDDDEDLEPMIYTLDYNGSDHDVSGTVYDLSAYDNPWHSNGGLVVEEATDGYYYGQIPDPNAASQQMTVLTAVEFNSFNGTFMQPIACRFDFEGAKNWLFGAWKSGVPFISLGYEEGDKAEYYYHGTRLSTNTKYWLWTTVDGANKILNMGVLDTDAGTVGQDIENRAILQGDRTWNFNEEDLLIGHTKYQGVLDSNYFTHGTVYHVEVIPGRLTKEKIVQRVSELEAQNALVYNLDTDGSDSGYSETSYDLAGYDNPIHDNGGLVVEEATDGYYYGQIPDPHAASQQMTVLTAVEFNSFNGTFMQPIACRFDFEGAKNWLFGAWKSGVPFISLGYEEGDKAEYYYHGTALSTNTKYWLWTTVDGANKILNMGVLDTDAATVGQDIENRAILQGDRTWNFNEEDLLIGHTKYQGVLDSNYFTHGTVHHVEVISGMLTKEDIVSRVAELEAQDQNP